MHLLLVALFLSAVTAGSEILFKSTAFDQGKYGAYPHRSYITEPSLVSPRHNVQQSDSSCDDGLYIMTSLRGDKLESEWKSPMIHDTQGNLVWMDPSYGEIFNLAVQRYKDNDYLTFWKGDDSLGHGEGTYIMLDSSYKQVYNFTAGNHRLGDFHEFTITEHGTALLTQYRYEKGDWGVGLAPQGYIWDSVFQEINIGTSEVLFEWHAYDHVDINKSDFPSGSTGRNRYSGYDFFHINSIDKDALGNYLISSRYYQCLMYISGKNGSILWELGGSRNAFMDLSDSKATTFGWQHDAHWTNDHSGITLFDNGARYHLKPTVDHSRGVHIELNLQAMTATLKTTFVNPRKILSGSQGSMQTLPSGNVLLGYGYNAAWTEFNAQGEVLCDVHIGSQEFFNTGAVQTYKVLKFPWVGRPSTKPKVGTIDGWVYMSWNGATEVKFWIVKGLDEAGAELQRSEEVQVERAGFETGVKIDCQKWKYVKVVAVDADGKVLGESDAATVACEKLGILKAIFVSPTISLIGFLVNFLTVVLLGAAAYSLWRFVVRRRGYSKLQQFWA
ncbi:ASST-domain-containing protein [Cadophora sp. MPI-SDFR-AT-0126]|nr:ASST-domain-containing protein [Leotiomycetes sp. MPI-SDFR-AT-0126]